MLKKINLQLFSENEEKSEEENSSAHETTQDKEDSIQGTDQDTDQGTDEEKVPLSTHLEEKKKRKSLEKKIRELEEKELDSSILHEKETIKKKYIDKGYDEDLAVLIADDLINIKSEFKKSKLKEKRNNSFEDDLKELSRQSYYNDALTFKKEIKTKIDEFSKNGIDLSPEDAYQLVRGKTRIKEFITDTEQKEALRRRSEESSSKVPNASSVSPKNPFPLDESDKRALAGLQKLQPASGWTAEKYWKIKNR